MNLEDLKKILNNNENCYYGHGTNGGKAVIDSIFKNGLRCSNNSLYFTSCVFGRPEDIDESIYEQLNNWPHLEAEKVVIVSLPVHFHILETPGLGTPKQAYDAFCYRVTDNEIVSQGKYVMPEFIVGCYNAQTKEFERNSRYYELLSSEEQTKVIEQIKKNYAQTLEEACGLEYYKELISKLPQFQFPLTDEECEKLTNVEPEHRIYI